jgi:uncharacterized GH25 family protein
VKEPTVNRPACLLILLAWLLATVDAPAHDTWLLPEAFLVKPYETIGLALTSGMSFPETDHAIRPDRLEKAGLRLAGKVSEIKDRKAQDKALRLAAPADSAGVAALWVALKPRPIELTAKQVDEYLDEIHAPKDIRETWQKMPEPRRWREVYTKHAKTFVRIGEVGGDHSWDRPVGLFLEIVPETDPLALKVGDELKVRVLKDGKPLASLPLVLEVEKSKATPMRVTDAEGRAAFRLEQPGLALLRGTELWAVKRPDADWESHFTTLTLQIRPR